MEHRAQWASVTVMRSSDDSVRYTHVMPEAKASTHGPAVLFQIHMADPTQESFIICLRSPVLLSHFYEKRRDNDIRPITYWPAKDGNSAERVRIYETRHVVCNMWREMAHPGHGGEPRWALNDDQATTTDEDWLGPLIDFPLPEVRTQQSSKKEYREREKKAARLNQMLSMYTPHDREWVSHQAGGLVLCNDNDHNVVMLCGHCLMDVLRYGRVLFCSVAGPPHRWTWLTAHPSLAHEPPPTEKV